MVGAANQKPGEAAKNIKANVSMVKAGGGKREAARNKNADLSMVGAGGGRGAMG